MNTNAAKTKDFYDEINQNFCGFKTSLLQNFFWGMIYDLFFFPKSYPHFCVLWVTNFNGTVIKENDFQVVKKKTQNKTGKHPSQFFLSFFRVMFVSESSAGKQR